VSKGAFYHHFPSKQAVFLELTASWLEKLDAAFQAAAQRASDVPEALFQMAAAAAQQLRSSDQQLPIILEFWRQANRDPAIWQAAVAPYRRYHAYFSDLVRRGVAEGTLQPSDPELVARLLISLALGLLLQALFDPRGADWGSETERSINLLVSNLLRRPA
jgi:AcrR family transcriptional regulator